MASVTTVAPGAPSRRRYERRIVAATAVGLLFAMRFGLLFGIGPIKLLVLLVGAALVLITWHRPMVTARLAVVWLPMSPILLAALLRVGLPVQMVSAGTYLRSGLVLALAVAGWGRFRRSERSWDALDRLGVGYLAVVALYLAIGPFVEHPPLALTTRLQGVQAVAVFVVALLAVRWLDLDPEERAVLRRWAVGLITFLAVVGLYQRLDQGGFNRIIFETIDLDRYFREVAALDGSAYYNATRYYFEQPLRVVSFAQNPFAFGDLMLVGVGLGLVGLVVRPRALDAGLVGLSAVGVFLCGNRISILAAAAMGLVVFVARGVSELAKLRFAVIAVFALVALMPLLLTSRLVQGAEYDTTSNEEHLSELTGSIELIVERPLGGGIGTDAFVSRRASVSTTHNSGNTVLGVGIQMGVLGLGTFIALLVAVARRTREGEGIQRDLLLARILLVGSFVSGLTHNAWQDAASGPLTWALIGLGVGASVVPSGAGRAPDDLTGVPS